MKTLVIGGTGPTGPFVVKGLLEQGHDVAILNRGSHESPDLPNSVERIIADPHFEETLTVALSGRSFDQIIASYGRLRIIAGLVGEHTDRLISVGGSPGYRGIQNPGAVFPEGLQVPLPEIAPQIESEKEFRFGFLVKQAEDAVMEGHAAGNYVATHLRYPLVYGPRQPLPCEWWVVKRILDKRKIIALPDNGLTLLSRGYAENMAHAVLLAVNQPETSGGKIYNCADTHQLTMAQWVQIISDAMDWSLDVVSVPARYAQPARDIMLAAAHSHHQLYDTFALRAELGYEDKVSVVEALGRTVDWYMSNPPELNASTHADMAEQYKTEDRLKEIVDATRQKFDSLPVEDKTFSHPYAHPKKPGEGTDHMGR